MKDLHEFLNTISPLSKETFKQITNHISIKKYSKKTILCNIGEKPKYGYFIRKGIIRASTINEKDKVFTQSLFTKNQFAGSHSALIQNINSSFVFETLTDCEVIQFEYQQTRDLADENHELMRFGYKILERFYIDLEKKIINIATKDAKERYLNLIKKYQGIEDLIPQYQIAAYLGVTAIQLSRIRKSIQ